MLIPIGFFGGGAAGSYELISTAYGTGSSDTISFTSIPSTYKHLQVRFAGRSTNASAGKDTVFLRLNTDTGTNYPYHFLSGNGTSVTSSDGGLQSRVFTGYVARNGETSGLVGAGVIDLLDYASTSKNKTVRSLVGINTSSPFIGLASGVWLSTSAVTSLQLTMGANAFTTASRFSLYGIKG